MSTSIALAHSKKVVVGHKLEALDQKTVVQVAEVEDSGSFEAKCPVLKGPLV